MHHIVSFVCLMTIFPDNLLLITILYMINKNKINRGNHMAVVLRGIKLFSKKKKKTYSYK